MGEWMDGLINMWVDGCMRKGDKRQRRMRGKRGREERSGEERNEDQIVWLHSWLTLVDLGSPSQYSLCAQQYFPPSISTKKSTLNSVLRVAFFRTH